MKPFKKIPFLIYKFCHFLIWWPLRLIFRFFLDFKVESKVNLKEIKGPLIIAANHSCWIDLFLVSNVFPFRAKIYPIRYACFYVYYYLFYIFLRFFGAFPIRPKIGLDSALKTAIEVLENKGVVVIFPEGRRYHRGRHRKARRGVAYLALKTKTKILPLKIEEPSTIKLSGFILRKYKVKIKVGEIFSLPSQKITKLKDLNKSANLIMKKIRNTVVNHR